MNAIDFFNDEEAAKSKCEKLSQCPIQAISWESETASVYSPGIVDNEELLARQIFSPIHVDADTNEVLPAAFQDVIDKGLSVNRLRIADAEQIHRLGEEKQNSDNERLAGKAGSEREYLGFVSALTSEVRSQNAQDESRLYTVYDTSLKDVQSHADICFIGSARNKGARMIARIKLQSIFSKTPQK